LLHHDRETSGQRPARSRECHRNRTCRCDESPAGHRHGQRTSRGHRRAHDAARTTASARTARRKTIAGNLGSSRPHRIGKAMSTAQEIMAVVGERLAANKEAASAIGAIYKFVLEGDGGGTWIMNLKGDAALTAGDGPSDCTLAMSAENGVALFEGKVSGEQLFFGNQLRVEGDMSLALRLQSLLAIVR
jgi:putative sterol carrier protein